MSIFFNGKSYTTPAVLSAVVDDAMQNRNPNVGQTLAVVGRSTGGKPNTALSFGNADEARAALVSGDLCDAVVRAFDPLADLDVAPATIVAVRVNPAVQSSLVLLSAAAASVITLTSTDYGLRANRIKAKVEAATTRGLKLTTDFEGSFYSEDNVYRDAFLIRYSGGQASGVMTVANGSVILQAPTGTTVATIDLNVYSSVQELVDRINTVTGFTASVLDGNGTKSALNGLDSVTAVDVKTADYTATAHLQAATDWFNGISEGYVNAVRTAGAGAVPAAIPYTYLAGGSDGTVTNTEWQSAFTTLQSSDVQWLAVCSGSADIHAMADAHADYMSIIAQGERRAICGTASGTSDAAAIAAAKALNSDRVSLVHLGVYDYNEAGALVLFEPYITAAMIAGAFASVSPGTPLTNKALKVRGIERKLRNPTDTDALIKGGVLAIEDTPTGWRVVQSISTWLTNDNYNRVEQSTGAALDQVCRGARSAVADLKGQKGSPLLLGKARTQTETALRAMSVPEPNGPGLLVGDENSPPYRNIVAKLEGDRTAITFECSPGIPNNFITITIYAVPYSGTAGA
jgi:hypothetical protein